MQKLVGRESELKTLLSYVEQGINKIVLVLGPELCGKSALLRALQAALASKYGGKKPVYYVEVIDVREWFREDLSITEKIKKIAYEESHGDSMASQPVFIIDNAEKLVDCPQPKGVLDVLAGIARDKKGTVILAGNDDSLREDWIEQEAAVPLCLAQEKFKPFPEIPLRIPGETVEEFP